MTTADAPLAVPGYLPRITTAARRAAERSIWLGWPCAWCDAWHFVPGGTTQRPTPAGAVLERWRPTECLGPSTVAGRRLARRAAAPGFGAGVDIHVQREPLRPQWIRGTAAGRAHGVTYHYRQWPGAFLLAGPTNEQEKAA